MASLEVRSVLVQTNVVSADVIPDFWNYGLATEVSSRAAGCRINLGVPAEEGGRGHACQAVRDPEAVLRSRDQISGPVPEGDAAGGVSYPGASGCESRYDDLKH